MKSLRLVNGQVITEERINGVLRITKVEPYDAWELRFMQGCWFEVVKKRYEL